MKRHIATVFTALLAVFTLSTMANAEISVGIVFSADEIRIIDAWYEDHGAASHRRGGKKQKGLPPGIAKNLARGKPLPPGIAKNYLPDGLRATLPPPPKGHERIVVDGKILLVEIASRVIRDVLIDIVRD